MSVRYARWDGVDLPFSLVESVEPRLAEGQALVRVDMATVCGSDVHTVLGHRSAPSPSVLGHEQVGRVVASSGALCAEGKPLEPGDRVVWSVATSCGSCPLCVRGIDQKCLALRKYGHERISDDWVLNGGYATHCLLLKGTTVVRVPDAVPDVVAAPASCATATVVAVLDAAGESLAGKRVLITGAGMLGVTAASMATVVGADVTVSDVDSNRLALAARFGARTEIVPSGRFDIAVELSGAAAAVETCVRSLDIGGRAVLAGSVSASRPVEIDPERVVRDLVTVTGVHNYRPRHLVEAVRFLAAHHRDHPFADLVEGRWSLDEVDDAVRAAARGTALRQAIAP